MTREKPRSIAQMGAGVILIGSLLFGVSPTSARGHCSSSGAAVGNFLAVSYHCVKHSSQRTEGQRLGFSQAKAQSSLTGIRHAYIKPSACADMRDLAVCGGTASLCQRGLTIVNGEFGGGGRAPNDPCPVAQPAAAGAGPAPLPQVTPGVVLTAIRRIGLPALTAYTQPEGKTLVNFPTIFYTRPQPYTRTLTLLGQAVHITATPTSYTWHYGDGGTATTSTPGARYPAQDITHEYRHAHVTVQTSVDVSYTATFTVGGGPARTIPGAVTVTGPSTPLRISEATPVLSGNHP